MEGRGLVGKNLGSALIWILFLIIALVGIGFFIKRLIG